MMPQHYKTIDKIFNTVILEGCMDINSLMDETGPLMSLWLEHFKMAPGWLLIIQNHAKKWQKRYQGLSERSWKFSLSVILFCLRPVISVVERHLCDHVSQK
jgi:hypothetical protein